MKESSMLLGNDEIRRIKAEENLIIDAQFLIQSIMNEKNLSRADLAKILGVSKSRLTQVMGTNSNLTLRLLARIFDALGETVEIRKTQKDSKCVSQPLTESRYTTQNVIERFSWKVEELDVSSCNDTFAYVDLKAA